MKEELLVRIYSVGCGDCIFIRVPDRDRPFHILIDCGNYYGEDSVKLKQAMANVEVLLNDKTMVPESHRGHLDLLVATHQHWDHIKGFESSLETFKRIKVDRVWLSVGMKKDHPQGFQLRALQDHVEQTITRFKSNPEFSSNPGLLSLLMSLSTKQSTEALTNDIPSHHGIQPSYVYREFEKDLPKKDAKSARLDFKEPKTKLFVLAPEKQIDESYVGNAFSLLQNLNDGEKCVDKLVPVDQRLDFPTNISRQQFRQLKTQLRYTSLLAAMQSNDVVNNTSVVLLLEWKGRRLIFPGDAQHESWNLMWKNSHAQLTRAIDFLKVSHHGSCNGTPYDLKDPNQSINRILESILPKENASNAQAVVSTKAGRIHAVFKPVPYPDLMNELASRVNNTKEYRPEPGKQPQRTDKEQQDNWIDIRIVPRTNQ
jgi:beta-lactamase superfamily II metal-dependent hydrolase